MIKRFILFFVNIMAHILSKVVLKSKIRNDIVIDNLEIWENRSNCFYSLMKRPKYLKDAVFIEKETDFHRKTVILIQGPISTCFDFLQETILFYKKLFPGTTIIISTWNNENSEHINMLKKMEVIVVLSKIPNKSGYCSLNYQVTNTIAGIKKAKELNKEYVFKTRTDYRFYGRNIINEMCCLMQNYPISKDIDYQEYRLVAGGEVRNSMFRPYWIADQFMFGYIDDMYNFWNYEIRDVEYNAKVVREIITKEHLSWNERIDKNLTAEAGLVRDYIFRMTGLMPETNVKSYWKLLKEQFIMVSRAELGFYWVKYHDRYDEASSAGLFYEDDDEKFCYNYNWTFADWVSLFNGVLVYREEYEKFGEDNHY